MPQPGGSQIEAYSRDQLVCQTLSQYGVIEEGKGWHTDRLRPSRGALTPNQFAKNPGHYHPETDGLALHHFYRAMAWLCEELPAQRQRHATPFAPRTVKDEV